MLLSLIYFLNENKMVKTDTFFYYKSVAQKPKKRWLWIVTNKYRRYIFKMA